MADKRLTDKTIFFTPDIVETGRLFPEESAHCIRVLRKKEGDNILITDGKGVFYEAVITDADIKKCGIEIINTISYPKNWEFEVQIAFAPTKNMERNEWFAEKATEIGIDKFIPLLCKHSERKEIKAQRIQKILVSAMKQSQKAVLPAFEEIVKFSDFIKQPFNGRKFIAHCENGQKLPLKNIYACGSNALILIGPEGDFSSEEIGAAISAGFEPISLGESRLRTETAALAALHTIHVLN